jgi:hypothetical protein
MKKVEKTRKNTKKGGPEKRSFFDPFVPSAFFGKKCEKVLANSPPSGTFSIFFVRPRSCFYTVLVLVVGGVQSGGNFFCSFLKTFFRVCTFVFAILGVDIIPGGGGSSPFFGFPHCGIEKTISVFRCQFTNNNRGVVSVDIRLALSEDDPL